MALERVLWRDEGLASVPVRRAFALKTGEGLRADDCLLMRRILLDVASSVTRVSVLVHLQVHFQGALGRREDLEFVFSMEYGGKNIPRTRRGFLSRANYGGGLTLELGV
jgi:hypothetical protein